jgi:hypothetical protein
MNSPENPQRNPRPGGEEVRMQHVTARVPESVSRGVFSTGVIVMTGGTEFVLDFIQNLGQPAQVAARVIMPHATMPQFIDAFQRNLELYQQRFGPPPELPRAQGEQQQRQPTAQEIYDELKIRDEVLSGDYCNAVMIGHTVSEFKFDFLTNLFPTSAVSSRVYLSAPQATRFLESLISTYKQFQQRTRQQGGQQDEPPDDPYSSNEFTT